MQMSTPEGRDSVPAGAALAVHPENGLCPLVPGVPSMQAMDCAAAATRGLPG